MKAPPRDDDLPPPYEPPPYGFQPGMASAPPYTHQPPQMGAPVGPGQVPMQQPSVVVVPMAPGQRVQQYQTPNGPVTVISQPSGVNQMISSSGLVIRNGGTCPNCRVGVVQDIIPWLFIVLAIIFFPVGLLCLCCISQKCSNCG